jgi:hypothetical protein
LGQSVSELRADSVPENYSDFRIRQISTYLTGSSSTYLTISQLDIHIDTYRKMDRHLVSPLLIQPLSAPTKFSSSQTYSQLHQFLAHLPASPARTQLERLTDALGVDIGAIAPGEGERREAERVKERMERRAERRRRKEEEERERLAGLIEDGDEDAHIDGVMEGEEEDGDMENVGLQMEGEGEMDDRGDVEYGDVLDEDEDEPDNQEDAGEDEKMDED